MLPNLVDPNWGILDDGVSLKMAHLMLEDFKWEMFISDTGRFFPLYWVYFFIQYLIFDANPFGFYLVDTLRLIITCILVFEIGRIIINKTAGYLAFALYLLSYSLVENYYTLSKPEPLLVLYFCIVIYSYLRIFKSYQRNEPIKKVFWSLMLLPIPIAYLTKETSAVLIPISFCWALISFALYFRRDRRLFLLDLSFFLANVVSFGTFKILSKVLGVTKINTGTYTRYYDLLNIETIITSLKYYASWVLFNKFYVIFVTIVVFYWSFKDYRKTGGLTDYNKSALNLLIWVFGWIGIFLPWGHELSPRYMIVSELGMALLGGIVFSRIIEANMGILRFFTVFVFGLNIVFSTLNLFNQSVVYYSWNKVNAQMIDNLAKITSPGQNVYINFPEFNEYVYETDLHLKEFYGKADIYISDFSKLKDEQNNIVIINPIGKNGHLFSRLGWAEEFALDRKMVLQKKFEGSNLNLLNTIQFDNHLVLQQNQSMIISPIEVSYGWELYSIEPKGFYNIGDSNSDIKYIINGFYSPENGQRWTNGKAELLIPYQAGSKYKMKIRLLVPDYKKNPPEPLVIKINDFEAYRQILQPGYHEISFTGPGDNSGKKVEIFSDTFIPSRTSNSTDNRTLGILLDWISIEGMGGSQ
jgi:hypothetical protein